ncbi:unnamed protein product, partial [Symbiodinium sp. KB8]
AARSQNETGEPAVVDTIDFFFQPAAELIKTIRRQNATIHQLRNEIEQLKHPVTPGYLVWSVSGVKGVPGFYVESPRFNLFPRSPTKEGTFWLRYYPEGTGKGDYAYYSSVYLKHNGTCDDLQGTLAGYDSVKGPIKNILITRGKDSNGLRTWGDKFFFKNVYNMIPLKRTITVTITKDCEGSAAFLD